MPPQRKRPNVPIVVITRKTEKKRLEDGEHVQRSSAMALTQAQPVNHKRPAVYVDVTLQHPAKNPPIPILDPTVRPVSPSRAPLSDEEAECLLTKRPLNGMARAILYFRGLGSRDICQVRRLFATLEIPPQAIQYISLVEANVVELIVIQSYKEDIMRRLVFVNVELAQSYDPLAPMAFTDAVTIERLGLVGKSEAERVEMARVAFVKRLDSMLKSIAGHRQGLRSFVKSLKKAVMEAAPTAHFFDPNHRTPPTLSFNVSEAQPVIKSLRGPVVVISRPFSTQAEVGMAGQVRPQESKVPLGKGKAIARGAAITAGLSIQTGSAGTAPTVTSTPCQAANSPSFPTILRLASYNASGLNLSKQVFCLDLLTRHNIDILVIQETFWSQQSPIEAVSPVLLHHLPFRRHPSDSNEQDGRKRRKTHKDSTRSCRFHW